MEASRAKAEYCGTAVGCDDRSDARAARSAVFRAMENMEGDEDVYACVHEAANEKGQPESRERTVPVPMLQST